MKMRQRRHSARLSKSVMTLFIGLDYPPSPLLRGMKWFDIDSYTFKQWGGVAWRAIQAEPVKGTCAWLT